MSFKRAIALALTALTALPAVASAQEQIPPPAHDHYLNPVFLKGGSPLVKGDILGITADTSSYTTQRDLFDPAPDQNNELQPNPDGGGGPEPTVCEGYPRPASYGNTIWAIFRSRSWGRITVDASSGTFDEVIRFIPFNSPDDPAPSLPGVCFDDLRGFQESGGGIVGPGDWYAVQVGGTINSTSASQGGPMQVKFTLSPPPRLGGDAVLSWVTNGRTAKIKSLVVNAPKGARVAVTCSRRGCGKNPRPFTARKSELLKPIAAVGPSTGQSSARMAGGGATGDPVAAPGDGATAAPFAKGASRKAQVRSAKRYKLLRGRTLKNGTRIVIRVYAEGYIGKHFSYKVTNGSVSSKTIRCTNPGSSTPRKRCG